MINTKQLTMFGVLLLALVHVVLCQFPSGGQQRPLSGLIAPRPPFVEKNKLTGNYTGYYVDLMNEISKLGEFNYTFKETLITRTSYTEKPESLIEEFNQRSLHRADFIIADYMFTGTGRNQEVEFTEPYHVSGLSVVVHKERLREYNIHTLNDLLEQRNRPRPTSADGRQLDELAIGTVRSGNTYQQLSMTFDSTLRKVYQLILPNPSNFVDSRENGIRRALSSPYAFLQEALYNELAVDEHCELSHFDVPVEPNPGSVIPFKYAIALRQGSPYVEKFNKAIRELKENGRLDEIKRRYFNQKCNSADSYHAMAKTALSIVCIFFSMTIANFLIA